MRRLCDSWTKSDDDKADTSRMDDDKEKVVEVKDDNEVEMLKTQMNSEGHKPRIRYTGAADVNKTTQELGKESRMDDGIPRRPRCLPWSYHHCLCTFTMIHPVHG